MAAYNVTGHDTVRDYAVDTALSNFVCRVLMKLRHY